MSKTIRAIYENGVLRPVDSLDLAESSQVLVTVDIPASRPVLHDEGETDPLSSIRFASGLGDLAQNFDDYRVGRKS